ncbi:MAG: hypothetical protein V3S80_06330 [Sulfurimonadaceae bacterium]
MLDFGLHGLGMTLVWLIPLLLIGALIYIVNGNKRDELSAKEILDKRYASGEIDSQEYQEHQKNLDEHKRKIR